MGARRVITTAILFMTLASAAVGSSVEPRQATPPPDGARYTVIAGYDGSQYLELRLDGVTGQTWRYERHDEAWLPVPCEALDPITSGNELRFQVVISDRSLWLIDTFGGQTWRWDRRPRQPGTRYTWSLSADSRDVEGWHLVR